MLKIIVWMWISILWEGFLSFRRFLLALTKLSFQVEHWALGNNSMKFWDFPDIYELPKSFLSYSATCEATRTYHFITNNLFHLWRKENLLNHKDISNILWTWFYSRLIVTKMNVSFCEEGITYKGSRDEE